MAKLSKACRPDNFESHNSRNLSFMNIRGLCLNFVGEFCERVQFRINIYIPQCKYQVKPHSPLWFSSACAASIVHRNHLFRMNQHNKSTESKVNPNLHMLIKQESNTFQKLGSWELW